MPTTRLNVSLPTMLSNELTKYADELHEKKSHIITSALEMYLDYLDLQVAEKRLNDNEPTYTLDEVRKDLGL